MEEQMRGKEIFIPGELYNHLNSEIGVIFGIADALSLIDGGPGFDAMNDEARSSLSSDLFVRAHDLQKVFDENFTDIAPKEENLTEEVG